MLGIWNLMTIPHVKGRPDDWIPWKPLHPAKKWASENSQMLKSEGA